MTLKDKRFSEQKQRRESKRRSAYGFSQIAAALPVLLEHMELQKDLREYCRLPTPEWLEDFSKIGIRVQNSDQVMPADLKSLPSKSWDEPAQPTPVGDLMKMQLSDDQRREWLEGSWDSTGE